MINLFGEVIELKSKKKKKALALYTNVVFHVQTLYLNNTVIVPQESSYYVRPMVVLLQYPTSGND